MAVDYAKAVARATTTRAAITVTAAVVAVVVVVVAVALLRERMVLHRHPLQLLPQFLDLDHRLAPVLELM